MRTTLAVFRKHLKLLGSVQKLRNKDLSLYLDSKPAGILGRKVKRKEKRGRRDGYLHGALEVSLHLISPLQLVFALEIPQ